MPLTPNPINTRSISLGESLDKLIGTLAENTHNVWASGRIKEGWQYGPQRNDEAKTTPCLVSYDDLPEREKQVDYLVVEEILKALIHCGYSIQKITE